MPFFVLKCPFFGGSRFYGFLYDFGFLPFLWFFSRLLLQIITTPPYPLPPPKILKNHRNSNRKMKIVKIFSIKKPSQLALFCQSRGLIFYCKFILNLVFQCQFYKTFSVGCLSIFCINQRFFNL